MLVVVMSLPPVMKKRDRPLVGDSPARIRVPMVGTVSLGGVVAVANGRCGIPRNQVRGGLCGRPCAGQAPGIKSGAASVVHRGTGPAADRSRGEDLCDACGVEGRGMEARRGSGRRRQRPPCGVLPGGTERPFKQAQERGGGPGSKQGTEAHRLPYGSSTVACATTAPGHSPVTGPRASLRQGPQPPQGAPGDDLAGPPAHPQDRRDLKRPAVSGGNQRGGPALGRDSAADGRIAPAGLCHPSHRTGRATFMASGSPLDGL